MIHLLYVDYLFGAMKTRNFRKYFDFRLGTVAQAVIGFVTEYRSLNFSMKLN